VKENEMNLKNRAHFHKSDEVWDGRIMLEEEESRKWKPILMYKRSVLYWLVTCGSVAGIVALIILLVVLISS